MVFEVGSPRLVLSLGGLDLVGHGLSHVFGVIVRSLWRCFNLLVVSKNLGCLITSFVIFIESETQCVLDPFIHDDERGHSLLRYNSLGPSLAQGVDRILCSSRVTDGDSGTVATLCQRPCDTAGVPRSTVIFA